ncbi:golgin candidate 4-like isoform X1 [Primulina huaijiensis]|uniref:golgin candidate 4-like isoform X1 n=1 Tax=Primulina huaijiensis TaxID=1492673 RepID=UPI003CC6F455
MWSSVANLKESLSKIALDVHEEDDDELSLYTPPRDRLENNNGVFERRISRNFNRSSSPMHSRITNGFDSPYDHEIERYKSDIKRLKESEAEIKALSVNYAALLKEKEERISRLTEENGSLKQNLLTTNTALSAVKTVHKGNGDLSSNRHNKAAAKIHSAGRSQANGTVPKQDGQRNGTTSTDAEELTDMMEENMAVMKATHETQMKQLVIQLEKDHDRLESLQLMLQDEKKLNGSFQQDLSSLKRQNDEMSKELNKTHEELKRKISKIGRLETELHRTDREETNDSVEKLKMVISSLENEKIVIKKEKDELEAALKANHSSLLHQNIPGNIDSSNKHSTSSNEAFSHKEEIVRSMQKLENDLNEARRGRDKAVKELNRLKQHLLEKESEESEKMDEDNKIIVELREANEYKRVQILQLEKALKQAVGSEEEIKMSNINELKKCKEIIEELNRKLTSCRSTIDTKNMEVLNLQTALGQYYAEMEAKERLGQELSMAKEASARLSEMLKEEQQQTEASKRGKEEILGKLLQAERAVEERNNRVKKLEEDNDKLRRALEQSMTRLNRMSVDSDFLVDRRIVIKLLVTYFQRNHSKEVLDLMVRMLGFSDEDKQRIGIAQQGAGKGVVRGVLGLPGRLVGGILGGSSAEASTAMSDDQSFADLWVDFLLKENEEKEKRGANNGSKRDQHEGSPNATDTNLHLTDYNSGISSTVSNTTRPSHYVNQNQVLPSFHRNFLHREPSDSEFSTVPLTSSENNFRT